MTETINFHEIFPISKRVLQYFVSKKARNLAKNKVLDNVEEIATVFRNVLIKQDK